MLYSILRLVSRLPLRVLYVGSDVVAWLLHTVVRYRRKVVRRNLVNSFPEKSVGEIKEIERRYYRFLGDYVVETLKLATMSGEEMCRRMRFEGMERVNELLGSGRNVALFLAHRGNWEWVSSMPLHLDPRSHPCQIYHRLRNAGADKVFGRLRARFGATNVPMDAAMQVLLADYRAGVPNITGYIADQSPKYYSLHHFVDFLNQQTGVLTGAERLARLVNAAVFYCRMTRPRRGEYVCEFIEIASEASSPEKFEITDRYWKMLEEDIQREPHLWLWSHRRWKQSLEGMKQTYPDDWEKRLKRL